MNDESASDAEFRRRVMAWTNVTEKTTPPQSVAMVVGGFEGAIGAYKLDERSDPVDDAKIYIMNILTGNADGLTEDAIKEPSECSGLS